MKTWTLTLVSLLVCFPLSAQDLLITSTDPEEDAVAVPTSKTVTFNLNKPTPSFGSEFATKFMWAPEDSTRLTRFGHDFDANGQLTKIFFKLDHTPNTDFSFIAYGVEADDGSRMHQPFVLNYTTAASIGSRSVSGTASFAERVPPASSSLQRLQSLIRRALERARQRGSYELDHPAPPDGTTATKDKRQAPVDLRRRLATIRSEQEMERTVVLLLDRFTLDDDHWYIRSASVADDAGRYAFDHVRTGRFWPVAINFADRDGEVIGAYGFYDADNDLAPDPIEVQESDVTNLQVNLYPFTAASALTARSLAEDRAALYASDQRLLTIEAHMGPEPKAVFDDGTAYTWRYLFYSQELNALTRVDVDPITMSVARLPVTAFHWGQQAIPTEIIDSRLALQLADEAGGSAFRSQHDDEVQVSLSAGDLDLDVRPEAHTVFWKVDYFAPSDTLTVFLDVQSGAILEATKVSVDTEAVLPSAPVLHANYPNPFSGITSLSYSVASQSHVTLQVYNMLGQLVETLVDGHRSAGSHSTSWNATSYPSGLYICRLHTERGTATRRLIVY